MVPLHIFEILPNVMVGKAFTKTEILYDGELQPVTVFVATIVP